MPPVLGERSKVPGKKPGHGQDRRYTNKETAPQIHSVVPRAKRKINEGKLNSLPTTVATAGLRKEGGFTGS